LPAMFEIVSVSTDSNSAAALDCGIREAREQLTQLDREVELAGCERASQRAGQSLNPL
jgi:hypothetical protein